MTRKIALACVLGSFLCARVAAELPEAINWRFCGWYGGGAYPMLVPDTAVQGRLYVVSDVGGIWRSDNRGDTWIYKTTGLKNLNVVNLAVAPANPNILYAGTSVGIHRSTDAGASWTYLTSTSNLLFKRPDSYRSLVVDPSNPDKVFAGTRDGQVVVSSDGGSTWQSLGGVQYPFGSSSVVISSLCLSADRSVLLAGSTQGLRRFTFQNGLWNTPSLAANKIYDIRALKQTFYVTYGRKVAWSSDRGVTWNYTNDISSSNGEAYRLAAHKSGQGVQLFIGWKDGWNGRMYLSANGGTSWSNVGENLHYDVAGDPTRMWKTGLTWPLSAVSDPFNSSILYFTDFWGVWRSDDRGQNWYEKIRGAPNSVGSDIAVSGQQIFVATMDDGLVASADGGRTFRSLIPGDSYDDTVAGHVWRVNLNGTKIVATNSPWNAAANQVLVSEDGGVTFYKTRNGLPATYPVVNTVWDKGYARALARDPQNPSIYYLGIDGDDGGGLFVSYDGGYHWTRSAGQPGSLKIYNGLAVDPVEPFRIYWASAPGGVWRSENLGITWSQVLSGYIFDLAVAGDGTAYAAADSSGPVLYVSRDRGTTWSILKRFPEASGTCDAIAINPVNSNEIAVSTIKWAGYTPGKVFFSEDGGATWTDITGDLSFGTGAHAMAFSEDGSDLYLSRGIGSAYCLRLAAPTDDTIPPSIPSNLGVSISGSTVTLTWNASTDNVGVTGYNVFRNDVSIGAAVTTSYADSATGTGQTYTYGVTARDAANNQSPMSNVVTVTIPPAAGQSPSNLTATLSGSQVYLSWQAPTSFPTYGYNIYRNGAYLRSCSTTAQYDSAVSPGSTYSYTVKAYDYYGNTSNPSNTATITVS